MHHKPLSHEVQRGLLQDFCESLLTVLDLNSDGQFDSADFLRGTSIGLDRDGDGLSNRLEYALDTVANVPTRIGLPVLGTGTGKDARTVAVTPRVGA